jgi:uncharacterized membrane protein
VALECREELAVAGSVVVASAGEADLAVVVDSVVVAEASVVAARPAGGDMGFARLFRHWISTPWRVGRIFPASTMARIEQAIRQSETRHGGQIRFAVEHALDTTWLLRKVTARERAVEIFSALRVWDTEHNNGVLIYLLLADRDVEIIADRGIHRRIDPFDWEAVCRDMESSFRAGDFEGGVLTGIERVSVLLQAHFPGSNNGLNELPDRPTVL